MTEEPLIVRMSHNSVRFGQVLLNLNIYLDVYESKKLRVILKH